MAENVLINGTTIVRAANLLLRRELVLGRTVWMQADASYTGDQGDTVTLKIPATLASRSRTMFTDTALVADKMTQLKYPLTLTDHIYHLLHIRDEELTLSVRDFTSEVLEPQMRAVAEGVDGTIATTLAGASVDPSHSISYTSGTDDVWDDVIVEANRILGTAKVPKAGRVLVIGTNVEADFLTHDAFKLVNQSGTTTAMEEATLARKGGFTIVVSNSVDPDAAYAYVPAAVGFAAMAPQVPQGAADGATGAYEGFAMRYLRDYAPENANGPVDRSLVDAFTGAASIEDATYNDPIDSPDAGDIAVNPRLVKITRS